MSLLLPLGLLGLLSLIVLLIIYILRPNFQQKFVSSTFVWKLSLKYQKKRIPISKLRNLLVLLCQIFILALFAMILAQPVILEESALRDNEKIVVIDASASMLAVTRYDDAGYTRFEAAVDEVVDVADETLSNNGTFTLILAGDTATVLLNRMGAESYDEVMATLAELKVENDSTKYPKYCTFGTADIEGAMSLAENITVANPLAEVMLYTGKRYLNSNGVTVVDMSRGAQEVNVAILDVRAVLEEGFYTFYADVVSYGENSEVDIDWDIDVDIFSGDGTGAYVEPVRETIHKSLIANEVVTVVFDTNSANRADGSKRPVKDYVSEYVSASASVVVDGDAIVRDNEVVLYGGIKPSIKVQYASIYPNKFFYSALMSFGNAARKRWDISIDEARGVDAVPALEGYDFYIFEHRMPSRLPTDGVVMLVNPQELPYNLGVRLGKGMTGGDFYLAAPNEHPLNKYMNLNNLLVTSYNPISTYPQEEYDSVMQCNGQPVFICKNTSDEKIAIMTFNVNYSDVAVKNEFPMLIYNMFEYFIPSTFTQYIFDVNDSITLNARAGAVEIIGDGISVDFTNLPTEYKLTTVGVHTAKQDLFGSKGTIVESFFVKIPASESDIFSVIDIMPGTVVQPLPAIAFDDLLVFFAAALVVLVLLEWWLQSTTRV